MEGTIVTILAGSLAALTLGVTAAHAEERDERGPQAQQQRHDRDEGWRYDRPQARWEIRREYVRYREARVDHGYNRNARVDVYDGDRGVSIDIDGFFAQR